MHLPLWLLSLIGIGAVILALESGRLRIQIRKLEDEFAQLQETLVAPEEALREVETGE